MARWLGVAFAGAIALGLLDVRLKKSLYDSNYLDVVASGLRILSFAGLFAFCLLIALPLKQAAPISEGVSGLLLMLGWVASVYCVFEAGITGRAVIHLSVVVAIMISFFNGAKLDRVALVSIVGLLLTTWSTVASYSAIN